MKRRLIFFAVCFLAQALLLRAAPLRVVAWDLQPRAAAGTNGWSAKFQRGLVRKAAESLKELHPDVILLQHVAGWETCRQLAQDLHPENYKVLTCSSWRDPGSKNSNSQVAILSKTKASLSWSESWRSDGESTSADGGFAFAAMQAGNKSVGIFSIQLGTNSALEKARFAHQIASLQNWKANRPQGYLLAADLGTDVSGLGLDQLGFEIAPLEKRTATSFLFARDITIVSSQLIAHTGNAAHDALICEVDLTAPKAALPLPPLAKATITRTNQSLASAVPANETKPINSSRSILVLAGFLVGGLALLLLGRKIIRRSEVQTSSTSLPVVKASTLPSSTMSLSVSETSQMDAATRAGLVASMSQWLKQKVVRQLVSDRARLMATQEVAALKMQAVDERLANVERQIQQRNRDYEQRIDHLLKSLVKAKEENRQLIRAQIAHLKAEIEKTERKNRQSSDEPVEF